MISRIGELAVVFQAAGLPVVHATLVPPADNDDFPVNGALPGNVRKRGLLYRGLPGAKIVAELELHPGDLVVEREHSLSGFHASKLERLLHARNVQTVVLAGVSTNIALPIMAAEAVNRLFSVVFAKDCTSGATAETHVSQVALHLPLLGAISTSHDITALVRSGNWRKH